MRLWRTTLLVVLILAVVGVLRAADIVCLPEVEPVTKTRNCYRCKVEIVCLPFKPKCDRCGDCGRPREVRKLIKYIVKEETCEVKCKPHHTSPACPR
jgi:hypothetical protein